MTKAHIKEVALPKSLKRPRSSLDDNQGIADYECADSQTNEELLTAYLPAVTTSPPKPAVKRTLLERRSLKCIGANHASSTDIIVKSRFFATPPDTPLTSSSREICGSQETILDLSVLTHDTTPSESLAETYPLALTQSPEHQSCESQAMHSSLLAVNRREDQVSTVKDIPDDIDEHADNNVLHNEAKDILDDIDEHADNNVLHNGAKDILDDIDEYADNKASDILDDIDASFDDHAASCVLTNETSDILDDIDVECASTLSRAKHTVLSNPSSDVCDNNSVKKEFAFTRTNKFGIQQQITSNSSNDNSHISSSPFLSAVSQHESYSGKSDTMQSIKNVCRPRLGLQHLDSLLAKEVAIGNDSVINNHVANTTFTSESVIASPESSSLFKWSQFESRYRSKPNPVAVSNRAKSHFKPVGVRPTNGTHLQKHIKENLLSGQKSASTLHSKLSGSNLRNDGQMLDHKSHCLSPKQKPIFSAMCSLLSCADSPVSDDVTSSFDLDSSDASELSMQLESTNPVDRLRIYQPSPSSAAQQSQISQKLNGRAASEGFLKTSAKKKKTDNKPAQPTITALLSKFERRTPVLQRDILRDVKLSNSCSKDI